MFLVLLAETRCAPPTTKQAPADYRYVDGNNNEYAVKADLSFTYRPIRPARSSSGKYDGGEPVDLLLTKEEHQNLARILETTMNTPRLHLEERVFFAPLLFRSRGPAKSDRFILDPDTAEVAALERELVRLRARRDIPHGRRP